MRFELGESPIGMGQKTADWNPSSRFRGPRWIAMLFARLSSVRALRTNTHEPWLPRRTNSCTSVKNNEILRECRMCTHRLNRISTCLFSGCCGTTCPRRSQDLSSDKASRCSFAWHILDTRPQSFENIPRWDKWVKWGESSVERRQRNERVDRVFSCITWINGGLKTYIVEKASHIGLVAEISNRGRHHNDVVRPVFFQPVFISHIKHTAPLLQVILFHSI